jgi:hypothetical protein
VDENKLVLMLTNFKEEIIEAFDQRIGIVEESFQHKLDIVVEGQQMLAERMEWMDFELKKEINKVDQRVTTVAADLTAHRADTEANHGVYRVKED